MGISPKVNAIGRLKFELAYYDVTVEHINHYAAKIPFSWVIYLDLTLNTNRNKILTTTTYCAWVLFVLK